MNKFANHPFCVCLLFVLLASACQPIQPQAAAIRPCTDQDKLAAYQEYVDGGNSYNIYLAVHPLADDVKWRNDFPPVFDEATQSYKIDPTQEQLFEGRAAFRAAIIQLMDAKVQETIDPDSIQINGQTLTVNYIASTPIYKEYLNLPLNDLRAMDTVEYDENCQITSIHSVYLPEALAELNKAKKAQTTATSTLLPKTIVDQIEAKITHEMQTWHIPALSIGIVMSDHVVYAQGFGIADVGTGQAVTPDTVFLLASVSKPFTAAAIMQLAEQGKIDLEAPFTTYLPDFHMADEHYKQITVRQLLSHQSGMPDYFDLIPDYWHANKPDNSAEALDNYVRDLQGSKLDFAPGTAWSYSTNGFAILGDIVAKVSGQSYEAYIHDHIFKPLGMDHSSFVCTELEPAQLASPYILDETKLNVVKADFYPYNRATMPGAGLCSNVADMTKWLLTTLNRGTFNSTSILNASSYDLLWQSQAKTGWESILGPTAAEYGLGWFMAELDGHRTVSHAGATAGFHAAILLAPDGNIGIVIMGNLLEYPDVPFYALDIGAEAMKILWTANK
jgi:CubicO group peptidase (beta-lactamase class C family)